MTKKQGQLFYTMSEVANMLHVSRGTIRKLVDTGELHACKICGNWRFPVARVENYLDKLCGTSKNARTAD